MDTRAVVAAVSAVLFCTAALAQAPAKENSAHAPKPDSASNARVGGWCDALTGEKKEQCLRDQRSKKDRMARNPGTRGSCDALIGPEKERCLRQGGSIEVGAKSGAGASDGGAAGN